MRIRTMRFVVLCACGYETREKDLHFAHRGSNSISDFDILIYRYTKLQINSRTDLNTLVYNTQFQLLGGELFVVQTNEYIIVFLLLVGDIH